MSGQYPYQQQQQPRPGYPMQPMQPRPMGQNHQQPPRPMSQNPQQLPRPMSQNPQQPPRPMSQNPQQPPRPMSQNPQQQPRPMGGQPMQPPRPMGQNPHQQPPRPMSQNPQQQPRPMGGQPMQPPRPMGQNPHQQPRPMGGQPMQPPRPVVGQPMQPRPSQPMQPSTQAMNNLSLNGDRRPTGNPTMLPPQQQPPPPQQPRGLPTGGSRPGTAPMGGQPPQQQPVGGPPQPMSNGGSFPPPGQMQARGALPVQGGGMQPPGSRPPSMGGLPQNGFQQQQQQQPGFAPPPQNGFQQQPAPPGPGSYPQQQQQPASNQSVFMDPNAQCDPAWMRTTFGSFPASDVLAKQAALPLGVVIQPLAEHPNGREPPVVDFGSTGVPRCRNCRAYINAFVQWLENGRRWRCNLCNRDNDTQSAYYCHLDANGQRVDRQERGELHSGCVEIVASEEYMIRPPQPPVFVFVLDVSMEAVQSGMLGCAVDAVRRNLDALPGAPRTQVALITFDYAVHFYSLDNKLSQPKMMIVSDLDELFLPCPEDLLVNLADSRESFEMLLESLPRIHGRADSQQVATGAAIQAAFRVMVHIGGKMLVFNTKLPSLGKFGKLINRENPRALDTDKEAALLKANNAFYTKEAETMSKSQVAVELFLFPNAYCDIASMQGLAKITGGQLHVYPRFSAQVKGVALVADIGRSLLRETAWESVFRLRASHGVAVKGFAGNFLLRGADLMQVANCDADAAYGLELKHTENTIKTQYMTLQGALLYTKTNGQRRIRVLTSVFPITTVQSEVHNTADQDTVCAFICKKASQEIAVPGLNDVRNKMQNFCINLLRSARISQGVGTPGGYGAMPPRQGMQPQMQQQGQQLPPNLAMLPYYTMAMIKNPTFRGGETVPVDERATRAHAMARLPLHTILLNVRPRMFELGTMPPDCGRIVAVPANQKTEVVPEGMLKSGDGSGHIKLPQTVNLSGAALHSNGVFLVNDGIALMLWIGRGADPRITQSLFGVPSLDGIDSGVLRLEPGPGDDDFKQRVCNILSALRNEHPGGSYQSLICFKEGDQMSMQFAFCLVEDRARFNGGSFSFEEFLAHCQRLSLSNINTN